MRKIAVPVIGGRFSSHFGGADSFAVFTLDEAGGGIVGRETPPAPPHERGAFPRLLAEQGVGTVLAGGMGPRAVDILAREGIEVVLGVNGDDPEALVRSYLEGTLEATGESCHDHGFHGHGESGPHGAAGHRRPGGCH